MAESINNEHCLFNIIIRTALWNYRFVNKIVPIVCEERKYAIICDVLVHWWCNCSINVPFCRSKSWMHKFRDTVQKLESVEVC